MIIEYEKENKIAFEDIKDKECFFSNGVLYMKIFSQDLKEYNISCVNAISILNAGLTKFDNDELVIKTKRIISKWNDDLLRKDIKKYMMDCKFLVIEDATSYHGDVFDHPDYKYTCEKCKQEVIPFLHCNKEKCKNYTKK